MSMYPGKNCSNVLTTSAPVPGIFVQPHNQPHKGPLCWNLTQFHSLHFTVSTSQTKVTTSRHRPKILLPGSQPHFALTQSDTAYYDSHCILSSFKSSSQSVIWLHGHLSRLFSLAVCHLSPHTSWTQHPTATPHPLSLWML